MPRPPKKNKHDGKPKITKLEDYRETKAEQISLFEVIDLAEHHKYSNTIELYDQIPKYFWGKQERINGEFLRPIRREFEHRGQRYNLVISPAYIEEDDGTFRHYFPSKREELVEDALRKFATEGQGRTLSDLASVKFTLHQLQQELKRNGHSYSKKQIKDALMICAGTHLTVKSQDGQTALVSTMFDTIGLQTREEWEDTGRTANAFVRFNPLVDTAIKGRAYRLYNYEKCLSYDNTIARQLHKRLAHHYKQASFLNANNYYHINLTTIIRDFGLTPYASLSHNLRDVLAALKELKAKDTIMDYNIKKTNAPAGQKKLLEATITIIPSTAFTDEVKKANWREKEIAAAPEPVENPDPKKAG